MDQNPPTISAIIPSLNGDTATLERALGRQTWPPSEIEVVERVVPSGLARNIGVSRTAGDILLFIDDDALPGQDNMVEVLVKALLAESTVGVTGPARILPASAGFFEQRVAAEIPRTINEIPATNMETNPPLKGYGHSLITTTCAVMRRNTFLEAGRFSNTLPRGVDTDLFYRIRRLGYRFLMPPTVYVEHPAPANLPAIWRKFFWYGVGYSHESRLHPERKMGPRLPSALLRLAFLLAASAWLVPNVFILYSPGFPFWRLGFRPLKAISSYAVAWGYVRGW